MTIAIFCFRRIQHVSSPFENPAVRYGIGLTSAVILVFVALVFLDGTGIIQWAVLGLAVLEFLVTPQILKMAVENQ